MLVKRRTVRLKSVVVAKVANFVFPKHGFQKTAWCFPPLQAGFPETG